MSSFFRERIITFNLMIYRPVIVPIILIDGADNRSIFIRVYLLSPATGNKLYSFFRYRYSYSFKTHARNLRTGCSADRFVEIIVHEFSILGRTRTVIVCSILSLHPFLPVRFARRTYHNYRCIRTGRRRTADGTLFGAFA